MEQGSFLENDNPVEFLYLDRNRVASLIGQLSEKGVLTSLTSTVSKTISNEADATGKIPGFAEVEGKHIRASQESAQETYDPFWAHAYSFLKELEASFAVPLHRGRVGSLVKFEARLQFLDLKIMRSLWGTIAQAWASTQASAPQPSSGKKRRNQPAGPSAEMKLAVDLFKELPHLLHMTFLAFSGDSTFKLWAAMTPEYMTISSEDLTMKFGAVMDGTWTVVGIVDGSMGESATPLPVNGLLDGVIQAIVGVRDLIGRPKDHFGLTPIAIYTPMRGIAEVEAAEQATELTENPSTHF